MKFLCVACDEAMKLKRTVGPDEGSMTVIFGCPACGRETAMLTNTMETQMVRSLGVKIGGRTVPAEPMEMVRNSLAQSTRETHAADTLAASPAEGSESKCPFAGVIADAYAHDGTADEIAWTKEAEERFARIPSFAQPMVRKGVELHARERGYTEINEAVMEEAKGRFDT
ncbi:MAG: PCP reductase family protein [Candidatus Krumholzibacteria bacterium]